MGSITDAFAPGLFDGRQVLVVGETGGIGLARRGPSASSAPASWRPARARAREPGPRAEPDATGLDFETLDIRDGAAIEALVAGLERLDVRYAPRG